MMPVPEEVSCWSGGSLIIKRVPSLSNACHKFVETNPPSGVPLKNGRGYGVVPPPEPAFPFHERKDEIASGRGNEFPRAPPMNGVKGFCGKSFGSSPGITGSGQIHGGGSKSLAGFSGVLSRSGTDLSRSASYPFMV